MSIELNYAGECRGPWTSCKTDFDASFYKKNVRLLKLRLMNSKLFRLMQLFGFVVSSLVRRTVVIPYSRRTLSYCLQASSLVGSKLKYSVDSQKHLYQIVKHVHAVKFLRCITNSCIQHGQYYSLLMA